MAACIGGRTGKSRDRGRRRGDGNVESRIGQGRYNSSDASGALRGDGDLSGFGRSRRLSRRGARCGRRVQGLEAADA